MEFNNSSGHLRVTNQIRVPHPNCILDADLAHQQAIHPSECELHEFYVLCVQMSGKRSWVFVRNMVEDRKESRPSMRATSSDILRTLR